MARQSLKKRSDGRYCCRQGDVFFYGNTSGEALAAREEYKRQLSAGLRAESLGVTFAEYAAKWVVTYKSHCTKNVYNTFVRFINKTITLFGLDKRMREITATEIQSAVNIYAGSSTSQIKKYLQTLRSIFARAIDDGVIIRNPCNNIVMPKGTSGTHRALEQWERELIHSMLGEHDFAVPAMLMLYGNLRRGEMLAFDVDRDVDFEKGIIHVREAVRFENNQPIIAPPKTKAGIRVAPLFKPLREALEGMHGLVLTKQDGSMASEIAFKRKFQSFVVAMETKVNGCHKRWYGRTKEHKRILAEGGELPPWIEINFHENR